MDSITAGNVVTVPPSYWDFFIALYFAVVFVAARLSLDRYVFCRLALWLLGKSSASAEVKKKLLEKIEKCSESLWKFAYYATVEACILSITYKEPWLTNTRECFVGWPNQELRLPLKLFYMCQCGFYVYSIAALLTWESWRKDTPILVSHHILTVILIGYSYLTRFFRIGSVILALHDASHVLLEAAKVFKYTGRELGASVWFGLFAISWLILRLIFFPFWVIYSSSHDTWDLLPLEETSTLIMYHVFNTMLLTLLVFHIHWWFFICLTIKRHLGHGGKVGLD